MSDVIRERLEEIEKRAEAATQLGDECPEKLFLFSRENDIVVRIAQTGWTEGEQEANGTFYYHSRTDVPLLVAALRRAEESRGYLAAALAAILENDEVECRADEDCDHCVGVHALKTDEDTTADIEALFKGER